MLTAVIGLGNPGPKYENTRHNAGFWFCDELAARFGGSFRSESRFHGDICKVSIALNGQSGQDVFLLKPSTFMNRSGQAIQALMSYYKLKPDTILVAHDELDIPPGAVKLKKGGGHGGHNGLRDTISHIGKEFMRLRLGVGHPGDRNEVVDYVLKAASKADQQSIDNSILDAADVIPELVYNDLEAAMRILHAPKKKTTTESKNGAQNGPKKEQS